MRGNPFAGAACLVQGLKLIVQPGLRRFVAIPLLVNTVLFAGLIWLGVHELEALTAWLEGQLPSSLSWLRWLLWPLFVITALLIVFYGFSVLANLIAAPFNGLLAERVEQHLTGRRPEQSTASWQAVLKDLVPAILMELRKLLYGLLWAIPFLILFLIPVLNLAAPFLWLAFGAWMLVLEYADYPMGNHDLPFPEQRRRLGQQRLTSLGFGAAALLLTMIPVANFIAMPAAVAGATALWVQRLKQSGE